MRFQDLLHLQPGESVVLVVRRHRAVLLPTLSCAALLVIAPCFFLFPLLQWGMKGAFLVLLSLIAGIVLAARTLSRWDATLLAFTNRRLLWIEQKGWWKRVTHELPLSHIQEVLVKRPSAWHWLCRMGHLHVKTVHGQGDIRLTHMAQPQRLQERLLSLRDAAHDAVRRSSDQAYLESIVERVRVADQTTLSRIEELLASDEV